MGVVCVMGFFNGFWWIFWVWLFFLWFCFVWDDLIMWEVGVELFFFIVCVVFFILCNGVELLVFLMVSLDRELFLIFFFIVWVGFFIWIVVSGLFVFWLFFFGFWFLWVLILDKLVDKLVILLEFEVIFIFFLELSWEILLFFIRRVCVMEFV